MGKKLLEIFIGVVAQTLRVIALMVLELMARNNYIWSKMAKIQPSSAYFLKKRVL